MEKKGQFFLIAAAIIVVIILGFIVISNYAKKEKYIRVNDMEDELKIESQNVLDYQSLHGDKIRTFGQDYSSYIGKGTDIYFITGGESDLEMYKYLNGAESVMEEPVIQGETIIVSVDGSEYQFELTEENFYFIISQEINNERYVVTG